MSINDREVRVESRADNSYLLQSCSSISQQRCERIWDNYHCLNCAIIWHPGRHFECLAEGLLVDLRRREDKFQPGDTFRFPKFDEIICDLCCYFIQLSEGISYIKLIHCTCVFDEKSDNYKARVNLNSHLAGFFRVSSRKRNRLRYCDCKNKQKKQKFFSKFLQDCASRCLERGGRALRGLHPM